MQRALAQLLVGQNHYGVGFVGVHDGRGAIFIFIDFWTAENELRHHVYIASKDQPTPLEYKTPSGLMACVWDLAVIGFERQIPIIVLALIEIVYLLDYARSIGGAIEWRSVALEGSTRWLELAGMIIGQLLILSILLIVWRHKPDSRPDLFGDDSTPSSSERARSDQADPPKHL